MVSSPLGLTVTLFGGGWTTGTAQVIGTTGAFDGMRLAQATGSDARNASGAGTIVLVTPTLARMNVGGSENIPMIATLTLNFVPELGTFSLFGSGLVAFGAPASRRRGPC